MSTSLAPPLAQHGSYRIMYHHQTNKAITNPCLNAAYWIAFGPHGPRSLPPPGENKKVILYTALGIFASFVVFAGMRSFARPPPATMTKEYQEATNEFLKVSILFLLSYLSLSTAADINSAHRTKTRTR